MVGVHFATGGRGVLGVTPALAGILAAATAFLVVFGARGGSRSAADRRASAA